MTPQCAECQRLERLVAELIASQEEERSELASELQHSMAQHLTALKCQLEALQRATTPEAIQQRTELARVLVDGLVDWVRRLSLQLRPSMLDDLGLRPALDWYVECLQSQTSLQVQVQHCGLERRFAPEIETGVFRITQELLQNVSEHACTQAASLRLWAHDGLLSLQVSDEGKGFEPEQVLGDDRGRGLVRVQQRVSWLGGSFDLRSAPGEGTCATVHLPLSRGQEGNPQP